MLSNLWSLLPSPWPQSSANEEENDTPMVDTRVQQARRRQAFDPARLREPVPEAFTSGFSMASSIEDAKKLLEDEEISRCRYALVPSVMREDEFWCAVFYTLTTPPAAKVDD